MLIDDSVVVRSILEALMSRSDAIEVVASVAGGQCALDCLDSQAVDVIVLDLEMPGMSGASVLPKLLRKSDARILVLSSNCETGGPAALNALALGAAETLAKPVQGSFTGQFGDLLVERVVGLAGAAPRTDTKNPASAPPPDSVSDSRIMRRPSCPPRCVAIGSSTGGISALNAILKTLDERVTAPILLTQHLPIAIIPFFAMQLRGVTPRTVAIAEHGMSLRPHHLYVAPGHAHLLVEETPGGGQRIALSTALARSGCRPSVDPMFASAAEVFGAAALAIVLSGMGHDGSEGARLIRQVGGTVVAQSQASCVVWGMPGSIVNAGLASAILDPVEAGDYVNWAAGPGR